MTTLASLCIKRPRSDIAGPFWDATSPFDDGHDPRELIAAERMWYDLDYGNDPEQDDMAAGLGKVIVGRRIAHPANNRRSLGPQSGDSVPFGRERSGVQLRPTDTASECGEHRLEPRLTRMPVSTANSRDPATFIDDGVGPRDAGETAGEHDVEAKALGRDQSTVRFGFQPLTPAATSPRRDRSRLVLGNPKQPISFTHDRSYRIFKVIEPSLPIPLAKSLQRSVSVAH